VDASNANYKEESVKTFVLVRPMLFIENLDNEGQLCFYPSATQHHIGLAGIKKFLEINHATMLIEQLNHALYYLTKFHIYVVNYEQMLSTSDLNF
jgi:hypothetical protein